VFYCEPCRVKRGWRKGFGAPLFGMSYGPCEVCQAVGECHDVPSRALPSNAGKHAAPKPPAKIHAAASNVIPFRGPPADKLGDCREPRCVLLTHAPAILHLDAQGRRFDVEDR
jgi:hypothetical protein